MDQGGRAFESLKATKEYLEPSRSLYMSCIVTSYILYPTNFFNEIHILLEQFVSIEIFVLNC